MLGGKEDRQLLTVLAEYHALRVSQLAELAGRNIRALRRRLRILRDAGLIRTDVVGKRGCAGRPEQCLLLDEAGVDILDKNGITPWTGAKDRFAGEHGGSLPHLLLVNEFRIHLLRTVRHVPDLSLTFLSPTSALVAGATDTHPSVRTTFRDADGNSVEFVPDGVFLLRHRGLQKTLLFFLEVDMGTEPLAPNRRRANSILAKLENYRAYYAVDDYRRYEALALEPLRRFRLLILTATSPRSGAVCRLTREMGTMTFTLIADQPTIQARGLGADVWVVGGQVAEPPVSILGRAMPQVAAIANPTPPPSDKTCVR